MRGSTPLFCNPKAASDDRRKTRQLIPRTKIQRGKFARLFFACLGSVVALHAQRPTPQFSKFFAENNYAPFFVSGQRTLRKWVQCGNTFAVYYLKENKVPRLDEVLETENAA